MFRMSTTTRLNPRTTNRTLVRWSRTNGKTDAPATTTPIAQRGGPSFPQPPVTTLPPPTECQRCPKGGHHQPAVRPGPVEGGRRRPSGNNDERPGGFPPTRNRGPLFTAAHRWSAAWVRMMRSRIARMQREGWPLATVCAAVTVIPRVPTPRSDRTGTAHLSPMGNDATRPPIGADFDGAVETASPSAISCHCSLRVFWRFQRAGFAPLHTDGLEPQRAPVGRGTTA